jgi:uncharacterized membrane protein
VTAVEARARFWLALVTTVAFLVCAVVVLIPIAERAGWPLASWLRLAFRPACHQMTDRCLDLGAGVLPICARCSGLYAGGFAGLLMTLAAGRRFQFRFRWLVVAAAPSIVDFGLGLVQLPALPNWPRFVLALVPGFLAGLLLADAVCEIAMPGAARASEPGIT